MARNPEDGSSVDVNVLEQMRDGDAGVLEWPSTAAALTADLLRTVCPPGPDEGFAKDEPDDVEDLQDEVNNEDADAKLSAGRRQLKREVEAFVPALVQLTRALLVQTAVNAQGELPAEVCADSSVSAAANAFFFVATTGTHFGLKHQLRSGARDRDAKAGLMAQPPSWWSTAWVAAVALTLLLFWGFTVAMPALLTWALTGAPTGAPPPPWLSAVSFAARLVFVLSSARSLLGRLAPRLDGGGSGGGSGSDEWWERWEKASRRVYLGVCPLLGWKVPITRDVAELRVRCRATIGRAWRKMLATSSSTV